MARPNQVTFVSGNVLTAAQMNGIDTDLSDVYDNLNKPEFATVRTSGTQNVGSGSATAIQFDAEDSDTPGWHDNSTNNTRITIAETGFYMFTGNALMTAPSGGGTFNLSVYFRTDGTTARNRMVALQAKDSGTKAMSCINPAVQLTAGMYLELIVEQDSGSTLAVAAVATVWRIA